MATFQSFWHGAALSPYEQLCITSFVDHGARFHLYAYEKPAGLPPGARWRDAAAILPRAMVFRNRGGDGQGGVSAFSDWFRYRLLAERGGWWVDTDVLCLSPDWPAEPRQAAYEAPGRINCAVLRARRGDALMIDAFAQARVDGHGQVWGDSGPYLLSALLNGGHDYRYTLWPSDRFYPIHYDDFLDAYRPGSSLEDLRGKGAVALHLWNEMMRRAGIDKQRRPPPGSPLHEAFVRHRLIDRLSGQLAFDEAGRLVNADAPKDQTSIRS